METYIAIIGAMEKEVEGLVAQLENPERITRNNQSFTLVKGALKGRHVLIARCGVGKVNAAICTQSLIDHYPVEVVINTGVAGGVAPQVDIGDLVISTNVLHHDFNVTEFGYPRGAVPGFAKSAFPASQNLVQIAHEEACEIFQPTHTHLGQIVSGDQFVATQAQKQDIATYFPEALCVEMEGAAIGHTAYVNGVPFVIIRAMSDRADNSAPGDFNAYLDQVIPKLNEVVARFVNAS